MMLIDAVVSNPWAILPEKLKEILIVLQAKENGEIMRNEEYLKFAREQMDDGRREGESCEDHKYEINDGIATIKVHGTLAKRMNMMMALSGGTSTQLLQRDFKSALANNEVKGIFLDVDSPGGAVDGTMDLASFIYQSRGKKPIMSFTDGLMASAAYWIGSAADYVVAANNTVRIGSIGVISAHGDFSKQMENAGIKVTVFASGKYKKIGNAYESLSREDEKYIQNQLDYLYTVFVDSVAVNRNVSSKMTNEEMAEGRIFFGSPAWDVGLIDEILNKEQAIEMLKEM